MSIFWALTGRKQVTGISPIPVTVGTATPATATDAQATPMPPAPVEAIPGLTLPAPVTVIPVDPLMEETQLGGSYINNLQVHDSSNISMCSSDLDVQENLKSHFNNRLSDKIYIII